MGFLIWVILAIIIWLICRNYKKGKLIQIDGKGYERDGYGNWKGIGNSSSFRTK